MSNPLDPIWDSYETAIFSLKVVVRCVSVGGIDRAKAFSNTRFYGLQDKVCVDLIETAKVELDDSAILSLYATFEATLRDHVVKSAPLLHAAQQPSPDFGLALAASFSAFCDSNRMDDLAELFVGAVGQALVARVGNIRKYRHWLAHGRRWTRPPGVTPIFTYGTLTAFLQAAGLT